jgi:uncharacterized protein
MQINYPFQIDGRGRTAETDEARHIYQLIEQVLFTDFGSSLQQLIFSPNNNELAAAAQFLVRGTLEQWLGDLIQVEDLEVDNGDAALQVTVQYVIRRTQERQVAEFSREV